ncbi:MAG: ribonuclease III [Succinivibrio sp.]|jgi:ribonuclease-3|nr:ribonuclease III [Succinivibrio sp.]MBQ8478419.1 ribonuclease III [Succinivibrio sp.]MCI5576683.1 ribonuclease III [Succinivibrio sp.]MCI5639095.1 ribonuclease III [Succinivibrio sp.]MCI6449769.1 ribonuclease III [Succinivibrio sp.]
MGSTLNVIELQNLELKLGYSFQNIKLLDQALTHRSFGAVHNERLEFLGDSILGMIIAKELYDRFPKCPEGDLTRMRSTLVRETTLAQLAREFGIGNCLRLGPGELKTGGFRRDSLIADAVESIIGAMFIDDNENFARVRQVVLSWFDSRLATIQPNVNQKDHKSTLQELLQSLHKPLPIYEIVEIKGTDNDQIFVVSAKVEGIPEQLGRGTSRRRAEQEAAGLVLNILEQNKK